MSPAGNVWDAALTGRAAGHPAKRDRGQYARIPRIRSVNRNASQELQADHPGSPRHVRHGLQRPVQGGAEKSLLAPLNKKAGRNSYGRITVRHRGGGNRRKYRIIDFKRNKLDMPAKVLTLEYDPNRSAHIALVQYEDGEKRYIIAPRASRWAIPSARHRGRYQAGNACL